jgi:hypothetical protein
MKPQLLALTLAASGMCAAHQDAPRHFRVTIQLIAVPHPVLTELTGDGKKSGSALHDAAFAHVKEGKAKLLETCMVAGRSGQKTVIESNREEIYPTEYEPPLLPSGAAMMPQPPMNPAYRNITAFETRNTGVTFSIEPTVGMTKSDIDLRFKAEVITPVRLETWMEHKDQWGDASIRMPVYERWSVNTWLSLTNGKFELAAVISPKTTSHTSAALNKILVFVRADALPASW